MDSDVDAARRARGFLGIKALCLTRAPAALAAGPGETPPPSEGRPRDPAGTSDVVSDIRRDFGGIGGKGDSDTRSLNRTSEGTETRGY